MEDFFDKLFPPLFFLKEKGGYFVAISVCSIQKYQMSALSDFVGHLKHLRSLV